MCYTNRMDQKTIKLNGATVTVFADGSIEKLDGRNGSSIRTPGTVNKKSGYVNVGIGGKTMLAHRVVAKALLPNWNESLTVNHINGIKDDNRVENLEMATRQEQLLAHQNKRKNCSSIYRGVSICRGKWVATCQVNSKKVHIGLFKQAREAAMAYNKFVFKNGFTKEALNTITPYRTGMIL